MNRTIASLTGGVLAAAVLTLQGAPSPSPTPTRKGRPVSADATPPRAANPTQIAAPTPARRIVTPNATAAPTPPKIKFPGPTPKATAPKLAIPQPTPKATPPKLAIPQPTPKPTAPKDIAPAPKPTATVPKLKVPDATPTPTAPKLGIPKPTAAPTAPKDLAPKPTAAPTAPKDLAPKPTAAPTAPKDLAPKPTAAPTAPKDLAPKPTAAPTAPKDLAPKPAATPKKLAPGPQDWKPAPKPVPTAPPLKGPVDKGPDDKGKGSKWKGKGGWNVWINIDVSPPPPTVIHVPSAPVYQAVPRSEVVYVQGGIAPVPEDYTPPPAEAPAQEGPTALRAWNGDPAPETRKFDKTRIKVARAPDETLSWQFFWQTTGAEPQAARWEIATVPFVGGVETFPPAGLVAYGDASLDADVPTMANFFAIDFGSLTQGLEDAPPLRQVYMRVVPVDGEGKAVVAPSNFVRVDLP